MLRRLSFGKNNHLTYVSLALNSRLVCVCFLFCSECIQTLFVFTGGYANQTPRQLSSLSLSKDDDSLDSRYKRRTSLTQVTQASPVRPLSSTKPRTNVSGPKREYTLTNSSTMVFTGENVNTSRPVGGNRTSNSLADNRRRIAAILGRK